MKPTGIVRSVDQLGRIVIPMELRRAMDIDVSDPMEVLVDEDSIVLRKYKPQMTCVVTGETDSKNMSFAGGNLTLSERGAQQLIDEIKSKMK